jgi:ribonucleoside-diphosphate reductase beta chain
MSPHVLFSDAWAAAWRREIAADERYRVEGRAWEGDIVLRVADAGDGAGAVYVDLFRGECRAARAASADDIARARLVIAAPLATWHDVLAGRIDPILGLLQGRLALERGSMVRLVPHTAGARALLDAAARIAGARGTASVTRPEPVPAAVAGGDAAGAGQAGVVPRRPDLVSLRRGLDATRLPVRLWHKAKQHGVWDPRAIDLAQDARDWAGLAPDERDLLLRLTALFQGGEEAVTIELLPLVQVVSDEGRLEDRLYLTSFLFEEAKHVEMFRRFVDEVAGGDADLGRYATSSWSRIFAEALPVAMQRLRSDPTPVALARASTTYNMIVEGVLAETGYRGYLTVLERAGILPGMRQAVELVKRDESRHIAYGLYLLSRLTAEFGEPVWRAIDEEMARLLDPALGIITEMFGAYERMPFDLRLEQFTVYAMSQFQSRIFRLQAARGRSLDEVLRGEGAY